MMYKPLDIVREVHSVHLLMMTVRNSTGIFYINLSHTHTYTHTHTQKNYRLLENSLKSQWEWKTL